MPTSSPPWPAPSTAAAWSYEDVDLAVLTVPTLLSKAEADAAMRVVLEDYGHYATGRKPREGEDALLVLDEFCALASGRRQRHQPGRAGPRRRRPGRRRRPERARASAITARRPGCWPRVPAGSSSTSAPTPSGCWPWPGWSASWSTTGSWTSTAPAGSPRPAWGSGPRIDPEAVRQAQPGEAWVIQAGQSIHLRVLPPPTVAPAPVELAATIPLADDTVPLPTVEEPAPVGIAAAVALAGRVVRRAGQRVGRRRERTGRLPSPARRPWLVGRPLPGRGRR